MWQLSTESKDRLPGRSPTRIARIVFRNSFCSRITIRATTERGASTRKEKDNLDGWKLLLKDYTLMKDPHVETESQHWHSVSQSDFVTGFSDDPVVAVRFFLYQPSVNWKIITLKNIGFFTFATATPAPSKNASNVQAQIAKSKAVSTQIASLSSVGQELFVTCKSFGVLQESQWKRRSASSGSGANAK
mmetsp:Transcript_9669/g.15141  ORF Transcript_9669/g.15141 Transcript_9669/m.15141 type:complete len:189 (-) Transcript_9669:675-1241(-)